MLTPGALVSSATVFTERRSKRSSQVPLRYRQNDDDDDSTGARKRKKHGDSKKSMPAIPRARPKCIFPADESDEDNCKDSSRRPSSVSSIFGVGISASGATSWHHSGFPGVGSTGIAQIHGAIGHPSGGWSREPSSPNPGMPRSNAASMPPGPQKRKAPPPSELASADEVSAAIVAPLNEDLVAHFLHFSLCQMRAQADLVVGDVAGFDATLAALPQPKQQQQQQQQTDGSGSFDPRMAMVAPMAPASTGEDDDSPLSDLQACSPLMDLFFAGPAAGDKVRSRSC